MSYDFDTVLPKKNLGLIKWELTDEPDVICMGVADMDFKSADCIVDALTKAAQSGNFAYHFKPQTYYDAITNWYQRHYDWIIQPEWLCNTPGTWAAVRMCLMTYTRPGDRVMIQAPNFAPIVDIVKHSGCELIVNEMILQDGHYELDYDDFEEKIRIYHPKVFFMVNPHNPTGRVFTHEELTKLGQICFKNNVLIISDEVHGFITYKGYRHLPACSVSDEWADHSIIVTAPSKGFNLMDLTYCYLIIPNHELRSKYERTMRGFNYNFATNLFGVVGVEAAFSEEGDQWLEAVTGYLESNLDYMIDFLRQQIPQIHAIRPEGGYFIWLDCRELGLTPEELFVFFEQKAKVLPTKGETFGAMSAGFERINIACPRKTLEEALHRIQYAVKHYKEEGNKNGLCIFS